MKKDIFTEMFPAYFYSREANIKSEKKDYIIAKKKSLSEKEILNKIINTSYNKKWPNGRIHGLDKSGNYVSHSVTPYAKTFLDNIEDKIKGLVLAFKNKGYFSISSCEGHSLWDRRFVMLIFPSKQAAEDFTKQLPFNLTYNLKHANEFLNTYIDYDQYGNINNASKQIPSNDTNKSLAYINAFTKRNYADAWFLEVIIADSIPYSTGLIKYFKNIKLIIFKKFFINSYTNKITDFITNQLPANIY